MAGKIQMKRGTYAAMDLGALYQGEWYYCTDTKQTFMAHGDGTGVEIPTSASIASIVDLVYPIGCIYQSVTSTSPATLFGGTWAAFGSGRVLVGIDAGQTEFDVVEETGGAKTHTLQITEIPQHNHSISYGSYAPGSNAFALTANSDGSANVGNTGGGAAHNNLQPYITIYRWKRTA